jgi:hypothetical protein
MRGYALLLSLWLTGGGLVGCGHGATQPAAIAVPLAKPSATPSLQTSPLPFPSTPTSGISPQGKPLAVTPRAQSPAAVSLPDGDGDTAGADAGGDGLLPAESQMTVDPPASAPIAVDGNVPPLAADRGTPPDYPDVKAREAANLTLTSQAAEFISPLLTPGAKVVTTDLENLGVLAIDLWYGSHIQLVGDRGAFYTKWTLPGSLAVERTSSHASSAPQFQIQVGLRDVGVLMGKTPDGDTWVQFERHAFHVKSTSEIGKLVGIIKSLHSAHAEDYLIYRRTKQNVGPLGLSPHTDKDPLVIKASKGG